jgi:hypothetical protein
MELVDGKGEPLNPPFNSVVREIRLDAAARRPAWLGPQLSQLDLARLLGDVPAHLLAQAATAALAMLRTFAARSSGAFGSAR